MNPITFIMTLFDDDSVKEKLTVMQPVEAAFDDERNTVPDDYWDLMENWKPGQSVKITMELVDNRAGGCILR